MGTGHIDGVGMCKWGPGRVDGAGTCRWGPGGVDGAQDAWEGAECASLSWWLTRGRHVLAVSMDVSGTRDMPVHVVHNEGECQWQDTDKGGYARRGMYTESLRVDTLRFCGRGVTADEGRPWQREGSRRANAAVCIM